MLGTHIINKIKSSEIAKDSFWAIIGNGLGSGLLLFAGIVIARYLGKDLYGEYGVVKTNMLYLAGFSTFGLGFTTTRFVARYKNTTQSNLRVIIKSSFYITLGFSFLISFLLFIFAQPLALYLDHSTLTEPFRILSIIIVIKALSVTGTGILAGLRDFKFTAVSSIVSGAIMLLICVPCTIHFGLYGSLSALMASQLIYTSLVFIKIGKEYKKIPPSSDRFKAWELIKFSFPVALQEISYSICNWIGILALTRFSSMGQVGLYTACAQWNAIILFLPGLLSNVVLSHLSKIQSVENQTKKVRVLLTIYLLATGIPFLIILLSGSYISALYGPEYQEIAVILKVLVFSTIPLCCSDIFKSKLMADGHPWTLFSIRTIKDIGFLILLIVLLKYTTAIEGAMSYAIASVIINILFFFALLFSSQFPSRK